ncbi:hypothetical protein [Endozoicomonas euniceicola]|uniref:DUF4384 domain-containing protein n=1 Tax=Endozoicomonas euniceicola TaxID=1234143 RepID=A0ABY6GR50_9GAMM|nr:hypothetical protein [Endozoicomonas euniceicola]UYM14621.1 hypothetical protein NX720_17215 [Endozoicomonas euniceicola]
MFRKSVLFIVFQFSWLVISEAALAELIQLEGQSHRFQYVHDDQTIDINLDPVIGVVSYVAAIKKDGVIRFYIKTENGVHYLYFHFETYENPEGPFANNLVPGFVFSMVSVSDSSWMAGPPMTGSYPKRTSKPEPVLSGPVSEHEGKKNVHICAFLSGSSTYNDLTAQAACLGNHEILEELSLL